MLWKGQSHNVQKVEQHLKTHTMIYKIAHSYVTLAMN